MNHPRLCAHLFAHMSKGVFRSLICKRQTTDYQTCFPAVRILLTSDYFVVSNEYASEKCIGVKVYILIRKCSGVKHTFVTLEDKTSHKGQFFEIEIYTSSES